MPDRNIRSKGFSLLEMVIVLAILLAVMGAVFQQITTVQKSSRTEEMKLDLTQEGREFVDQFGRDLRQAGYPNARMFAPGVLVATADNDSNNAVGLVKFAYDEVWLEADVNGDGTVQSINYKLQTDSGTGKCPCRISRGWVQKDTGNSTSPWLQGANTSTAYKVELQDVANSGGANGGTSGTAAYTIDGTTNDVANDTMYASYKDANVFTAFDAAGNEVPPAVYSTAGGKAVLGTIKSIRINLNLLARQGDLQTGKRPVITFSSAAKVGNN